MLKASDSLCISMLIHGRSQWLFDLSRAVPRDYELHSFDIDFGQAPPAAWCPQNILRRQWDVTQDVPPDLVGYFDIVNIRYFVFIVKDDDPRPLLRNLVKLLSMHPSRFPHFPTNRYFQSPVAFCSGENQIVKRSAHVNWIPQNPTKQWRGSTKRVLL